MNEKKRRGLKSGSFSDTVPATLAPKRRRRLPKAKAAENAQASASESEIERNGEI